MYIPIVIVFAGLIFLCTSAYFVHRLLMNSLYYRLSWLIHLCLIYFFITTYTASVIYALSQDPFFINYFYALILLFGSLYVYLTSYLSIKTIRTAQEMEGLRSRLEELRFHAEHDELTGCSSRKFLFEVLNTRFKQIRLGSEPLAVMFLDLDKFKRINDQYGHDVGDKVLQAFSQYVQGRIRKDDTFARYGGDEFVLLCETVTPYEARKIAQEISEGCNTACHSIFPENICISCSIGISFLNKQSSSVKSVIKEADEACYKAKHSSNGSACLFNAPFKSVLKSANTAQR